MTARTQVITGLMILCILAGGAAGCAPRSIQPTVSPNTEPTALPSAQPTLPPAAVPTGSPAPALPSGWETYSNPGQCGYAIDHPSDMSGDSQNTHSWILNHTATEPSGPVPNFIYISVIPDDFQSSEPGAIYNYDPAATQTLLDMPVGESR